MHTYTYLAKACHTTPLLEQRLAHTRRSAAAPLQLIYVKPQTYKGTNI